MAINSLRKKKAEKRTSPLHTCKREEIEMTKEVSGTFSQIEIGKNGYKTGKYIKTNAKLIKIMIIIIIIRRSKSFNYQ